MNETEAPGSQRSGPTVDAAVQDFLDRCFPVAYGIALHVTASVEVASNIVRDSLVAFLQQNPRAACSASDISTLIATVHTKAAKYARENLTVTQRIASTSMEQPDVSLANTRTPIESEAIALAYYGALTAAEIAERLGIAIAEVGSYIDNGLRSFSEQRKRES